MALSNQRSEITIALIAEKTTKSTIMKKHFFSFMAVLFMLSVSAQGKLQKEFVIEKDAEDYNLLPAGDQGLIMTFSTESDKRGIRDWHFQLYDTDFEEKWALDLGIDDAFSYVKSEMSDKNVLHIFYSNSKHTEYYYVMVDIVKKKIDHFGGLIPIKASTSYFSLIGDHAVFGGNADYTTGQTTLQCCLLYTCIGIFLYDPLRDHATLNYVDYEKKTSKPIIVNFREQTTLNDLSVNEEKGEFTAVIEVAESRTRTSLYLLNYDDNGKEDERTQIRSGKEDVALLDGFSHTEDKDQFVIGTYATKSYSSGAEGIYFTSFEKGKQKKILFYEMSDFKEFWGDYSKRITDRIEKRSERRKKRGKSGLTLRILPTKIEKRGDELVYIGESYYIDYRYESYYDASTQTWKTRRVFDGYVFTHGIVAGFDDNGKMKWHHSYPIGTKTYTLSSRTKAFNDEESGDLLLVYQFGNHIYTQVLSGNKLNKKKDDITILPDKSYEKFRSGKINFEKWYDNYFVSYGQMDVKDKDKKLGKRKETIFYFSKIEYE